MSSYHCELIIVPICDHEFKHKILARQIFSKFKNLIYELICVKNNVYPATIKNDNESAAISKTTMRRKRKQQLHQFKKMKT